EAAPPVVLDAQIEVLQGLCLEFGSSEDFSDASSSAVRWIHAAVGEGASVRISLADDSGRLRTVAETGPLAREGRHRSTRRRQVFQSQWPKLINRDPGSLLMVLPLVCRGRSVGVLEVVGPRRLIAERQRTLNAVANQLATAVHNLRHREGLQRQVESLTSATDLVRKLVRAETFEAATRAAMRLSFRVLKSPVAGWVRDGEHPELRFLAVRGTGTRKREELRKRLPSLRGWETSGPSERARVAERFSQAMEVADVAVIDGGDAVILAGGNGGSATASLGVVGSLFQEVLQHLSTVARAERRNEQIDLGIAWTAHEVRGPLLAAKAAIDHLLQSNGPMAGEDLLSRSGQELGELAGLVDALLRWAVGAGPLQMSPVDLVGVVRQTIETCCLGSGEDRLDLVAVAPVLVRADPEQLRSAIGNVIRNALAYAPADSRVTVVVAGTGDIALVSVKDHGPGIPAGDREAIFEPLARGRSGRGRREGHGLGLFIARRVVEAHGGMIWAESANGHGTTFKIQLPVGGNGHHPPPGVVQQGFSPELANR
ncbi:MAG: ATP-binding protein, partial [Actinomycetota bacterium]